MVGIAQNIAFAAPTTVKRDGSARGRRLFSKMATRFAWLAFAATSPTRRRNLLVGASRRCLDIYDYCILDVDEVVQPISELHALVGLGCPCRLRVRRQDTLGRRALI